jgi:Cu/Ag efflux protein CusF
MLRLPRIVLALLALAMLLVAAGVAWAEEPTRGTVQSVSADKNQITVTDKAGKNFTFRVMDNAPIFVPNEPNARLANLRTGEDVSLLWEKKGDQLEALAILLHQGEFRNAGVAAGTIRRLSADTNEFMVMDPSGKEWTYHLANNARVRVHNQSGKLSDFKVGDKVVLAWDKEGNQYMVRALCSCPTTR